MKIKNSLGGIKGAAQLLRDKTQTAGIDEYITPVRKFGWAGLSF